MDTPKCAGSEPVAVQLEAGRKYAWCSCGLSSNQPFCDGKHNQEGCDLRPVVFTAESDETVWFCLCKQTGDAPRCDGSHNTMAEPDSAG